MVLIEGEKWACLRCIRGHRVSSCQHQDRELHHVARKGRPISQCTHCRHTRKGTRALHLRCGCGKRLSRCKHLRHPLNGHDEKCCRNHGALCSCHNEEKSTILINMRSEGRSIGSDRAIFPGNILAGSKWRIPSPSSPTFSGVSVNNVPLVSDDAYTAETDREILAAGGGALLEKGLYIGHDGRSDTTTGASSPGSAQSSSSQVRPAFKTSLALESSSSSIGMPLSSTDTLMISGAVTASPFSTISGADPLASLSFDSNSHHLSCQPPGTLDNPQCDYRRSSSIVNFQNLLTESGQMEYPSHLACVKYDEAQVLPSPYDRRSRQGQCDIVLSDANFLPYCKEHTKSSQTPLTLSLSATRYEEQQAYWIQSGCENMQMANSSDMHPTCFLFETDNYV